MAKIECSEFLVIATSHTTMHGSVNVKSMAILQDQFHDADCGSGQI